ncbi:MAG TPA: MarR family transcriptional regulator [bacterium]|nr:MarR family transcriptional regulator [bacterium]
MNHNQILARVAELEEAMARLRQSRLAQEVHCTLRPGERFILRLIASCADTKPLLPSELARKSRVTLAAVTHHLNTLEEQGYITRQSDPDNRRQVHILLTAKGRKLVKTFQEKMFGLISHLGDAGSRQLINLIKKTAEYMTDSAPRK